MSLFFSQSLIFKLSTILSIPKTVCLSFGDSHSITFDKMLYTQHPMIYSMLSLCVQTRFASIQVPLCWQSQIFQYFLEARQLQLRYTDILGLWLVQNLHFLFTLRVLHETWLYKNIILYSFPFQCTHNSILSSGEIKGLLQYFCCCATSDI